MDSFKDLFVQEQNIPPRAFARAVLNRCLRNRAKLLYWPTCFFWRGLFEAEIDLVNNVGRLTSPFDLDLDITEYRYHPYNQNPIRRTLGLTISTTRLRRLVYATFNANSTNPHSRKRSLPPPQNNPTLRADASP